MRILGIETTCDATAAAVIERSDDGAGRILSNVVHAQTAEHAAFGDTVPDVAARAHVELLDGIVARAMQEAETSFAGLDGVAAAAGPGLIGGVIAGLTTAKAIALVHATPLIAVNHIEAHALTPRLTAGLAFPYCLLLASGGHTEILAVLGVGRYQRLAATRDDAIGEAFDKVAKLVGLPYPGGSQVEIAARTGNAARFNLPTPPAGGPDADFALADVKTALRGEVARLGALTQQDTKDLCAAFQAAVLTRIAGRVAAGLDAFRKRHGAPRALVACGGIATNQAIRGALQDVAARAQTPLIMPPPALCADNGAIVAWAGAERLALGLVDAMDVAPRARWPLGERAAAGGLTHKGAKF